jgi:NAD(P)-dependent dehydrogenase (short-subunit alcohol dehydrogenase family)
MKSAVTEVTYDFEPLDLKGSRCIVSGGTTGIGRAAAVALASRGADVLVYGRHEKELDDALQDIGACATNSQVQGMIADQARRDDVRKVFREATTKFGGLDILINNAGLPGETVGNAEDDWEYVVAANLIGYMWCCEEAIPLLKESGKGQIVNIGSLSAKSRSAESDVYVATKSGLRGFTESLSKKLAKDNIRVMLIEPGKVSTDFFDWSEDEREQKTSAGEAMKTEDIAEATLFGLTLPKRCLMTLMQIRPLKDTD